LHAARHPSVDAVVAFEPDLFNAYLLDRNLCANRIDKVVISACAIGARPRTARLYRYKSSNLGRHSLLKDYGRGFRVVPQLDLDTALDELGFGEVTVRRGRWRARGHCRRTPHPRTHRRSRS
jgi:hypothetical protein